MTFSLILFLLTVFTGVLWVLDVFIWAPKRRAAAQDELTAFDRDNADSLRRGEQTVVAARNAIVQASTDRPKWLEYTAGFFPVIFFIFILRSFLFEPFRIPSGSMMPTLETGDMILVNKYQYGLRLPVLITVVQTPGAFLAVSPIRRGPFFIIYTKIIKLFPKGYRGNTKVFNIFSTAARILARFCAFVTPCSPLRQERFPACFTVGFRLLPGHRSAFPAARRGR